MNKRLILSLLLVTIIAVSLGSYVALSKNMAQTSPTVPIDLRETGSYAMLNLQRTWFSVTLHNSGNFTIDGDFNATVIMKTTEIRMVWYFTGEVENLAVGSGQQLFRYDNTTMNLYDSMHLEYYYIEISISGYKTLTMTQDF